MEFKTIFISSRSLTIELINNDIVTTTPYDVYLNGELLSSNESMNVYSIYNLNPNTEYLIMIIQNGFCY